MNSAEVYNKCTTYGKAKVKGKGSEGSLEIERAKDLEKSSLSLYLRDSGHYAKDEGKQSEREKKRESKREGGA